LALTKQTSRSLGRPTSQPAGKERKQSQLTGFNEKEEGSMCCRDDRSIARRQAAFGYEQEQGFKQDN